MSGWIKVEKDLANDPRVLRMASRLSHADVTLGSRSRLVVVGALVTLWWYADTHICDDDVLAIGANEVDELVGLKGFCELMPPDWLQVLDADHIKLVDYTAHNGSLAKNKALAQKRQQKHRAKPTSTSRSRHAHVTPTALPDRDKTKTETRQDIHKSAREFRDDPEHRIRFETLKTSYPRGTYRQSDWLIAEREVEQRLCDGHTWLDLQSGIERYAKQCEAKGGIGTQYVLSPAKFFAGGPIPMFLDPFPLPATKSDVRLAGNVSAAEEFMRRTESG